MTGMINQFTRVRHCPHDKSELVKIVGTWKMDQVMKNQNRETSNYEWAPTGFIFTASIHRCDVCGYSELVDEP